jgi:RNA polymerase-binding transcription factor DksA
LPLFSQSIESLFSEHRNMAKSKPAKPAPKAQKAAASKALSLKAKASVATAKKATKPAPAAKKKVKLRVKLKLKPAIKKAQARPKSAAKKIQKPVAKPVSKKNTPPAKPAAKVPPMAAKPPVKAAAPKAQPVKASAAKVSVTPTHKPSLKPLKVTPVATTPAPQKKTLKPQVLASGKRPAKEDSTQASPVKISGKPASGAIKVGSIPLPKRTSVIEEAESKPKKMAKPNFSAAWVKDQKERILELRDSILESMHGVAKDTLRSRAEGSEASAFGMHQADAGSDAYDRDFALSLLSQEQDALYEIEEALKRIELGTYGVCEISGKQIPTPRLEALPFARYTVECQTEVERQGKLHKARLPVTSLFGLTDEESQESEDEDQSLDSKE